MLFDPAPPPLSKPRARPTPDWAYVPGRLAKVVGRRLRGARPYSVLLADLAPCCAKRWCDRRDGRVGALCGGFCPRACSPGPARPPSSPSSVLRARPCGGAWAASSRAPTAVTGPTDYHLVGRGPYRLYDHGEPQRLRRPQRHGRPDRSRTRRGAPPRTWVDYYSRDRGRWEDYDPLRLKSAWARRVAAVAPTWGRAPGPTARSRARNMTRRRGRPDRGGISRRRGTGWPCPGPRGRRYRWHSCR